MSTTTPPQLPDDKVFYKVFTAAEWAQVQEDGSTPGTALDVRDGFIHCSIFDELAITVQKYYKGTPAVYVCAMAADQFTADDLRWDYVESRRAFFPHLLCKLKVEHILWTKKVEAVDGVFPFPEDFETAPTA